MKYYLMMVSAFMNRRVFRSAEFFMSDHRLVVATLKLHFRSARARGDGHSNLNLEKLSDPLCRREFAARVGDRYEALGASEGAASVWETFRDEVVKVATSTVGISQNLPNPLSRWRCVLLLRKVDKRG